MGRRLYSEISRMLLTLLFVHVEPMPDFKLDHGNIDVDFVSLGPPELLLKYDQDKAIPAHGNYVLSTSSKMNPAFMSFFIDVTNVVYM
jgi:hypothetical protein